jgi:hypothetical protein
LRRWSAPDPSRTSAARSAEQALPTQSGHTAAVIARPTAATMERTAGRR